MTYANPLYRKEYNKAYRQRDYAKVRRREYQAEWRKRNLESIRKKQRDANKEKSRTYFKAYVQRDYVKVRSNEKCSKRRALEIRTSKFELNNSGNTLKLFKLSNKKTKETGRDYHVDHIVPLQGRLVSGFHVSGNLRVVLADTNLSKHNHYIARDESLIQRRMVKDWIANGVKFKLYKPKKGA
jgi:hypothetical protein